MDQIISDAYKTFCKSKELLNEYENTDNIVNKKETPKILELLNNANSIYSSFLKSAKLIKNDLKELNLTKSILEETILECSYIKAEIDDYKSYIETGESIEEVKKMFYEKKKKEKEDNKITQEKKEEIKKPKRIAKIKTNEELESIQLREENKELIEYQKEMYNFKKEVFTKQEYIKPLLSINEIRKYLRN